MGRLSEMLGENIDNEASYQKMVDSIRLSLSMTGMHNMFIAVCDNHQAVRIIIGQLSVDISEGTLCEVALDSEDPNILSAIKKRSDGQHFSLIPNPYFSIVGSNQQLLTEDNFFGHLQWSYLRYEHGKNKELEYPNILWLDTEMLVKISKNAPDYYAHVKGVFYFDYDLPFTTGENNNQL